jgi:DNA polymerase-3 subunit gamma/tau
MSTHIVLARKWRPKRFSDLIGQNVSITVLKNIIKSQRIHHAYLLTGTRGVGKTTIARIIAKALNCQNLGDNDPCCICESCLAIDTGKFIDVIEIDAASNTGVDNIREIIDNAVYLPTQGKYKLYIIDEVHMLSKSAFNALLKTLEEPPQHVVFILATTDPDKLPITVISRCIQLKLSYISNDDINKHLQQILATEQIKFEADAIYEVANRARGSMRDALSILDQAIAYMPDIINIDGINLMLGITDDKFIANILDDIIQLDFAKLNQDATKLYQDGTNLENVLLRLSDIFSKILVMQLTNIQYNNWLDNYKNRINLNDLQLYFEICNLGIEQIKKIDNKFSSFIMTLMRMLVFRFGDDLEKQQLLEVDMNKKKIEQNPIIVEEKQVSSPKNIEQDSFVMDLSIKDTVPTGIKIIDNNDWLELIKTNQSLFGPLFVFVSNSILKNFNQESLLLTIEERYRAVLDSNIEAKLNDLLIKMIGSKFQLQINYELNIIDSLAWQIQEQNELNKNELNELVKKDQKLITLLDKFSGIILPNSIKKF